MLEMRNVKMEFRENGIARCALSGLNLRVSPGEVVAVIGPNGAGKSTLGNVLVRDIPTAGTIMLGEVDVTRWPAHERASLFGRLTQNPSDNLSDAISIVEHFVLARSRTRRRSPWFGISGDVRRDARERLAALRTGLEGRVDDLVTNLSGGERQMVALGLLTVSPPKVLVLDEPTSALDLSARVALHQLALELIRKYSLATIWVTHDIDEALKVGHRLVLMSAGRIACDFSGETLEGMTRDHVARLMSEVMIGGFLPPTPPSTERATPLSN